MKTLVGVLAFFCAFPIDCYDTLTIHPQRMLIKHRLREGEIPWMMSDQGATEVGEVAKGPTAVLITLPAKCEGDCLKGVDEYLGVLLKLMEKGR